MSDDDEGLTEYVGGGLGTVASELVMAWVLLSQIEEDRTGRAGVYVSPDWIKTTRRILRGWAELHERPHYWPWNDPRMDIFKWGSRLVVGGEVVEPSAPLAITRD